MVEAHGQATKAASTQQRTRSPFSVAHAAYQKPAPLQNPSHLERPQAGRARVPQPGLGGGGGFLQLGGGKLRPQLAAALIQQGRLWAWSIGEQDKL